MPLANLALNQNTPECKQYYQPTVMAPMAMAAPVAAAPGVSRPDA